MHTQKQILDFLSKNKKLLNNEFRQNFLMNLKSTIQKLNGGKLNV